VIEQISKFVDVLNAASTGTPQRVTFSLLKIPSATEFILIGDRLLYNKNIKLFHKIIRDLLYGNMDVSCSPIGHLGAEPILFFDVHQFVWETINKISDEDIIAICNDIETITVSKTKHPVKDFSLFSRDSVDSIVVFYFQLIPKPATLFLQDFETTNRVHYYRSLIRMALLDYIKLESVSVSSNAPKPIFPEEYQSSAPPSIPPVEIYAPDIEPVIDKIFAAPQKSDFPEDSAKENIEKQIEHILQEKPATPLVPISSEQKNIGNRSLVSKTRIENLKKILQNIKKL